MWYSLWEKERMPNHQSIMSPLTSLTLKIHKAQILFAKNPIIASCSHKSLVKTALHKQITCAYNSLFHQTYGLPFSTWTPIDWNLRGVVRGTGSSRNTGKTQSTYENNNRKPSKTPMEVALVAEWPHPVTNYRFIPEFLWRTVSSWVL